MRPRPPYLALWTGLILANVAPVNAQSLEEMKAQLRALQTRIEQLEAAQRRAPPARATSMTRDTSIANSARGPVVEPRSKPPRSPEKTEIEANVVPTPGSGKPGLSFMVPGTSTVVRPYGSIKLNGITDLSTQNQNDTLTAQSIPLANTAAQRIGGDTQVSARRSRIGLETWTPVNDDLGEFHTQVEFDFAGQNTNLTTQATTSSYTPRLRKAFADFGLSNGGWGAVLFGQTDTLFSDKALLPMEWMSDWTFVGTDGVRQGQIRYTYGFGDGLSLSIGVEAPYSDVTTSSGTSYPNSDGGGGFGWQRSPDFTGRALYTRDCGILALRGVVRPQINLNNHGASAASAQFNKSTTGYGLGATVVVRLLDGKLELMASGNAGNGIGRYLDTTANGFGAVSNFGLPGITAANASVNAVGVYGGMIGARYFFTPALRANVALGGAGLGLPGYTAQFGGCVGSAFSDGTCSSVNTSEWSGSINVVWSPFKMLDIGVEYQYVERALRQRAVTGPGATATSGVENRLQLTALGRF